MYGNVNRTAAAMFAQRQSEMRAARASANDRHDASEDDAHANTINNNKTLRQGSDSSIKDLMPLLSDGKVDMYVAGHWHYYESLWPSTAGPTGTGGSVLQKSFVNSPVPIHVTTGNGGPPGADNFHEDCPGPDCGAIPATRSQSMEFGYGRLTAYNNSHLRFQQIINVHTPWFSGPSVTVQSI